MKLIFKSGQRRGTKANFHLLFCFNLNLAQSYTVYPLTIILDVRSTSEVTSPRLRTQPVKNKMKKQLNLFFFPIILSHVILKVQYVLSVKTSAAWRSCSRDPMKNASLQGESGGLANNSNG